VLPSCELITRSAFSGARTAAGAGAITSATWSA
jgi:hypothetical protein